ncbi:MAG TPA: tetratricopeptide repeat protein [Thermoanaerobaculia bacterium]|nr:tetratricopeptide repeat protein [Thermoanaerobaculia bacterium]
MTHPTSETLAAFAGGNVDVQTRADVLAHLDRCNDCMIAAQSATAFLRDEAIATRSPRRWWIAAAAAIVAIAIAAVPLMLRSRADGVAQLVAFAPRDERVVEPRLTGGFAYAPYRGPMRANETATNEGRLRLGGAAGEAIERAQRDSSNDAQRAAAIALVLIDRPAEAIDRLHAIATRSPNDVRVWNDLAAARYVAAVDLRRPSLLPEALAAADRALRIDPQSHEALFNRALILDRLGRWRAARAAWERYVAVDASSPWANEARRRLSRLPAIAATARPARDDRC